MKGRPSLGVQSTNVRLTSEAREKIRALVGDRGLAQFIREAIDHELERRVGAAKQKPKRLRP